MFEYELKNGIGILLNPTIIDMAVTKIISFKLPIENGTLKIGLNCFDIKDFYASVPNSKLTKGSNIVKIVLADKTIPCQPLRVFASNDKIECTLACAVDVAETLKAVINKVSKLEKEIEEIKAYNVKSIYEQLNTMVEVVNDLTKRVAYMEVNYDPTLIN